jgi:pimeloyl-ACP methyl ester carboxylesterase
VSLIHRQVPLDGIELHVASEGPGDGPPVLLLHGFPELWYSWRHQLPALAAAGYRAIAPDLRGYGGSSAPQEIEAYDMASLCGDVIALIDQLGAERAVVIGHDWGAAISWQLALAHPDRIAAVAGLSVPFVPRAPAAPIGLMRQGLGEDFYIVWFQKPGVADEALGRDVRRTLTTSKVWTAEWGTGDEQPRLPEWMTEDDARVYIEAFERTGFTGGLNYYRNIDRNWEQGAALADKRIEQPALFVTGSRDPVQRFMPAEAMKGWVTNLVEVVTIDGAGHWVQQQSPEEVNEALVRFLRTIDFG